MSHEPPDTEPRKRPAAARTRRLQQPSAAARGERGRRPRPRERQEAPQEQRLLAVVGVAALLVIGLIVMISLFTIDGDDDPGASAFVEREAAPERRAREDAVRSARAGSTSGATNRAPLTAEERDAREVAVATLDNQGYKAVDPRQWQPRQRLRVLIGKAQPASGQTGRKAFFFVGSDFLGADAEEPSAKLLVAGQSDTEIALRYVPYEIDDPPCCPTGTPITVRFSLENGRLVPLEEVPPPDQRRSPLE